MQITIDFNGFYDSNHDSNINWMLESYYSDENGDAMDYYSLDIPYDEIRLKYAVKWVRGFNEWLHENYALPCEIFKFNRVKSPREYNFTTDKIVVSISEDNINQLDIGALLKLDIVKQHILDATTHRSGYIPFYSYDFITSGKSQELTLQCIFSALSMEYESDDFMSYFDRSSMHELLYRIEKMPQLEGV